MRTRLLRLVCGFAAGIGTLLGVSGSASAATWVTQTIDNSADTGATNQISFDGTNVHIHYSSTPGGGGTPQCKHAFGLPTAGTFTTEVVINGGTACGGAGTQATYVKDGFVRYAYKSGASWVEEVVDGVTQADPNTPTRFVNTPVVGRFVVWRTSGGNVKYAAQQAGGGAWSKVTIANDATGGSNQSPSLVWIPPFYDTIIVSFRPDFHVHIHENSAHRFLGTANSAVGTDIKRQSDGKVHTLAGNMYGLRQNSGTLSSEDWTTDPVTSRGGMFLQAGTIPYISNGTTAGLKLHWKGFGAWGSELVDGSSSVGMSDITADSNSKIVFSYYDSTNTRLRYARQL
jgi:hypothetical protein